MLTLLLTRPLYAEEDCSKALIPSQEFQYLNNIDKVRTILDTQQSKGTIKNDSASGKYGDISGSLGLSDNQQESVQAKYSLGEDWAYSGLFARNAVSIAGYSAYRECISKNSVGVTLIIENIYPESTVLRLMFRTADGRRSNRRFHIRILTRNAILENGKADLEFATGDTEFDHKFFVGRSGPGVITIESEYDNSPKNDIVNISPIPQVYKKVENIGTVSGSQEISTRWERRQMSRFVS